MAEGTGLENRGRRTSSEGSNPSLSATICPKTSYLQAFSAFLFSGNLKCAVEIRCELFSDSLVQHRNAAVDTISCTIIVFQQGSAA